MPSLASISINDGKATPVAHVFSPVTTNGQKSQLANRASSVLPLGNEELVLELSKPGTADGAYRLTGTIRQPTVATVDGLEVVDHESKANFALNFSQKSTSAERKDLCALVSNLFAHATVKTMAENLEPQY